MNKIHSSYTINATRIHTGAYSVILSATRDADDKNVIIKLLNDEHPSLDDITRFKHEYDIAKLFRKDKSIIHVYSLEKIENKYAITMENINGPTLAEILEVEKKLNLIDFIALAIEITTAMDHIHQNNIIHKDINPTNIMFRYAKSKNGDGKQILRVKIIDFGLSANLPREHAEITNPNVLEGTLAYLSPEQTGRMNRGVDYRTDFYSLGITFYQILTGVLPFTTKDSMELVHCHIASIPKSPHELDASIPEALSNIIMKLIAKAPEDRYQNANGLIEDLMNCQKQLRMTGKIAPFALGTKDIFNRFQIPEKLYGRQVEIEALMSTYDKVMQGHVELMLIAGYAGIGKSSLVHEIHKPIVAKHGFFISGKFEQFKHNIPYAAITAAFNEFVKQLLTEPKEKIASFRQRILTAVRENGSVILDVVPNLAAIIGEQPPVVEIELAESEKRFSYVFQKFINALVDAEHPLVMFLDDLQWADLPSLKLLKTLLMSPDCGYFFVIGAYRSNELSTSYPLLELLDELKKSNIETQTIELGHLQLNDVTQLIADTLHHDLITVQPLAQLLYEKTGGNPFFLVQLLLSLYKEKLIEFNSKDNEWIWEFNHIKAKSISDNVVNLMVSRLQALPPNCQKILHLAACIGNQFNLDILAYIADQEPGKVLVDLQAALQEGYIIAHGEAYRAVAYQFAHDRIQQAAYLLQDEASRKITHINLARLLLNKTSKDKLDEAIFNITNHFNIYIEPIVPETMPLKEKEEIANLNLQAAKLAKSAAAFEPALKYAEYGLKCMDKNSWQNNYNLMFALYAEAIESAALSGKYDLVDSYVETTMKEAKTLFDEVRIVQSQIQAKIAQMKSEEAIKLAIKMLKRLGVNVPNKPGVLHILLSIMKIKYLSRKKKVAEFLNLPEMTNPIKRCVLSLYFSVYSAAYIANQNLFAFMACSGVIFSLRYGNAHSSTSYSAYGVLLCALGDIEKGYQFGELASALSKHNEKEAESITNLASYVLIKHWKENIHTLLPKILEIAEDAFYRGDLEYACYDIAYYVLEYFLLGYPLQELLLKIDTYKARINNAQQYQAYTNICIFHQAILNVTKKTEQPELLVGEAYDEVKMLPILLHETKFAAFNTYACKLVVAYLFGKYTVAFAQLDNCDLYEQYMAGSFIIAIFHLYKALTCLQLYPGSTFKDKWLLKRKINASRKKLEEWSKHAPENFMHKLVLVDATIAWRMRRDISQAAKLYNQAIRLAKKNGFANDEALANILAAEFCLAQDNEKFARVYMEDARYCFQLWGADAIVASLEARYSQLLTPAPNEVMLSKSVHSITSGSSSSRKNVSTLLDISTIQKSSLVISSTIVLSDLLKKLMQIVIENAGAQQSFLLLNKDDQFYIEAGTSVDHPDLKVLQSIALTNDNIPLSIINYVIQTKEYIVLNNATHSDQFMNDPYILKKHPKSILCIPLLNKSVLSGILYMENNAIKGAFAADRIEVLNLLSSQIAMSIDNARLYNRTVELNEQLSNLIQAFERFVPEDFLSLLGKESITDVVLGDNMQGEMSVLFADIRDFTRRSEKLTPRDNFNFINSFLNVMAPIIKKHHGFIDKYIGDAIMAIYPRNADDALRCALEMQNALEQYNSENPQQEPVRMGIGINTGLLMLGTVGEKQRMNATVISDVVNVAARLEPITKEYQVPILISSDTFESLPNKAKYLIEKVASIQVKGKTQKISVYSVKAKGRFI